MAWYDVGTVSVTNGSTTVTGSGTDFISGVQVGEGLYIGGDLYEIAVIVSSTELTLADAYLGSTATGQEYKIIPTQSLVADLSSGVADLIADFADVRDYAGNGKFDDGTATQPAITFTQDQNNGLYRIGSDNYGLSAGGIKQIDISTTDVELNHGGNKKLATTATGVDVTGTVTADGLTVEGNNTGGLSVPNNTITLLDTDTSSTAGQAFGAINFSSSDTSDAGTPVRITGVCEFGGSVAGSLQFETGTPSNLTKAMQISYNGDVHLYEDTGTTAKFIWDSSAEGLRIGSQPNTDSGLVVSQDGKDSLVRIGGLGIDNYGFNSQIRLQGRNESGSAYYGDIKFDPDARKLFLTAYHSDGDQLVIDSSGNVGINTASPSVPLQIQGDGNTLRLDGTANTSRGILLRNAGTSTAYLKTDGNLDINCEDSGRHIAFKTADTERVRIDSSGNVGIGTTSLTNNTSIRELHIDNGITNGVSRLRLSASGESQEAMIAMSGYLDSNSLVFSLGSSGDGSATERMRIDSNGRLGIGSTAPTADLHIRGTNAELDIENNTGRRFRIQSTTANSLSFIDKTINSERARIDSSGNLLVGTTTATTNCKLKVEGAVSLDGIAIYRKSYASVDTAGFAVAGLLTGFNGVSTVFEFTGNGGGAGGAFKILFNCYNTGGTWNVQKEEIVTASNVDITYASGVFTFKSKSGTASYTPTVKIETYGGYADTSYF